jgi:AcrR family transcriptional regulator
MRSTAPDMAPREKILEAAEALFARRGFAGVGMSEIAEAVGLGKSSLFHHFPTKAQLYAAVVERILIEIESALTRALAAGGSPVERFDRWVDTIVDLLGAQPAHSRLLLRSLFEDDERSGPPMRRWPGSSTGPGACCARAWRAGRCARPAFRTPCRALSG